MAHSKPSSFDPSSRPVRFCDEIEEKHKCFHCSEVLLKPVQSFCGHRYCFSCKDELIAENRNITCKGDEEDCNEALLSKVFEDKGTVRDLSKLLVFCPNQQAGCHETPTWKNLDVHLQNCEFAQKRCPSKHCTFMGTQAMIQTHLANECEYVLVSCELCQSDVPKQHMDSHYKLCFTQEHTCKYKRYGCTFRGHRDALLKHQRESSLHFDMILKHGDEMEQKLDCVEKDLKQCIAEKADFHRQLQDMCNEMNSIKHTTTHRINQQQKVLASCAEKIAVAENAIVRLPSTESIETQNKVIRDLQDVSKMLNGRLEYLEQADNSKSTPDVTSDGKVVAMETTIHQLERQFAEYEIRFRCIETASFDGSLVWKIANYSRRKRDAIEGRTLSLYSQPFYTSPYGYKMCARVYLNGDGIGARTHLSLFFVIMKGEYDSLLQWPFRQKVSLSLLDQSGANRGITDTFRPDPTSTSFRRPVGDMNIASGCPLFAAQTTVEAGNYVKDDTIFIKVEVEKNDLRNT